MVACRLTAHLHENMIYEGRDVSMFSFPGFPKKHSRIIELTDKQIWAKSEPRRVSSNCWRDYIGSWGINEGKLYLIKLERDYDLEGDEPLFADWVTAELHIIMDSDFPELRAGLVGGEKIRAVKVKNGLVTESHVVQSHGPQTPGQSIDTL